MAETKLKNRLFTTHATATGGRNGKVENDTKIISLELSVPKSMGGPGREKSTTPEDLFAAGYAACFGSACEFAAKSLLQLSPSFLTVKCEVTIGQNESNGYGLEVLMRVLISGLLPTDAQRIVDKAHEICPYSNAVRGNVPVRFEVRTTD